MDQAELYKFIVAIIFYGVVGIVTLLSMLGIYIYLRYGQSKTLGVLVTLLYIFVFAGIAGNAQRIFANLTF